MCSADLLFCARLGYPISLKSIVCEFSIRTNPDPRTWTLNVVSPAFSPKDVVSFACGKVTFVDVRIGFQTQSTLPHGLPTESRTQIWRCKFRSRAILRRVALRSTLQQTIKHGSLIVNLILI